MRETLSIINGRKAWALWGLLAIYMVRIQRYD